MAELHEQHAESAKYFTEVEDLRRIPEDSFRALALFVDNLTHFAARKQREQGLNTTREMLKRAKAGREGRLLSVSFRQTTTNRFGEQKSTTTAATHELRGLQVLRKDLDLVRDDAIRARELAAQLMTKSVEAEQLSESEREAVLSQCHELEQEVRAAKSVVEDCAAFWSNANQNLVREAVKIGFRPDRF